MKLEIIMLNKINQTSRDKYFMFSLIYGVKKHETRREAAKEGTKDKRG
jgi:hypothetical protein